MKKTILTLATIAALAACSSDESVSDSQSDLVAAKIAAGEITQTRAVNNTWMKDTIGVMALSVNGTTDGVTSLMTTKYKNVPYATTEDNVTKTTFTALKNTVDDMVFFHDANETVTFAAYAPYQKSTASNTLPGTDGVVTVNTTNNKKQEAFDFLYASGATASKLSPTVTFSKGDDGSDYSFHHKMTRLDLKLTMGDGFTADEISSITNIALGGLIHEGTFNVATGETATTGDVVDDWNLTQNAKQDISSGTLTVSLILLPQTISSPLALSLTADSQPYENTTQIKPSLEAGKKYIYNIKVNKTGLKIEACEITDWTEEDAVDVDADMPVSLIDLTSLTADQITDEAIAANIIDGALKVTGKYTQEKLAKVSAYVRAGNSKSPAITSLDLSEVTGLTEFTYYGDNQNDFEGSNSLTTITLPTTVTRLVYTFIGCTALKTISGLDNVETLNYAFGNCSALEKINLPKVKRIKSDEFTSCDNLTEIRLTSSSFEYLYAEDYDIDIVSHYDVFSYFYNKNNCTLYLNESQRDNGVRLYSDEVSSYVDLSEFRDIKYVSE